ncbi:dolichyl-phosphate beta-D-mannosyltransferase [Candidatus Kuenenbacteria bacterium CG11_big_fil_rev_8_21_14_0_20_37_9]|uniref:Dolichyl-phosphate beta-D-mannosyltransferase n=2 Tax=Candidatus Kueneniibacteriota TaxID=1752740 RepID=A0A2M6XSH0_9BACT|nr:MAG: hypothetical protein AUJ29_00580 [Candidatus Kuenenbacteria bacterium CG1_02_38_13]PIR05909.1 MAG: dolichyl-phosphate beta-D-mannosyltransferase [Candidatus Kuenenbacteria bacterium CG11_big_fil_rev_8_21_14_0_20_37_9]PIU10584.1 MAG: dolichyl-phosphate beta-D-mannosyltransferase [Candidatus Kuenenbacteria bacterium CG08_land_8_20_14_0_20_37_23]
MLKCIVIPTYNESENIVELVKAIFSLSITDLHIVVVDDNSPDGTGRIVSELAREYPLTVINRKGKLGLGSAYVAGFKKAFEMKAGLIFEMDADFSHNPRDIPRLLEEISQGNDVVIGSRRVFGGNVLGWNTRRNFQSKCAMLFARFMLGLKTKDITAGFRCFRSSVLENIGLEKITSNSYAFQEEVVYLCEKNGFKVKEIPVTFIDRQYGKSKLGVKDILEFFWTIFRLRFKK